MRIPRAFLEQTLEQLFGDQIKRYGDEWVIPSFAKPWKWKLYVNVRNGKAIDFIGGTGYSADVLLMKLLRVSRDALMDRVVDWAIKNNVDLIAKQNDIEPVTPTMTNLEEYPKVLEPLNERCLEFLASRYISPHVAEQYRLVYVPVHEDNPKRDHDRLFLPVYYEGELVFYQTRALEKDIFPKYYSAKGVNKNFIVFNLDKIDDRAIITEGIFDAMKVDGQCIFGSAASEFQVMRILAKNPKEIIIVPDEDEPKRVTVAKNKTRITIPGYEGALKTIHQLIEQGYPIDQIKIAFNEESKDLGDLPPKIAKEIVDSAVKFNLLAYTRFVERGVRNHFLEKLL